MHAHIFDEVKIHKDHVVAREDNGGVTSKKLFVDLSRISSICTATTWCGRSFQIQVLVALVAPCSKVLDVDIIRSSLVCFS
jgi:hypothetical protein